MIAVGAGDALSVVEGSKGSPTILAKNRQSEKPFLSLCIMRDRSDMISEVIYLTFFSKRQIFPLASVR